MGGSTKQSTNQTGYTNANTSAATNPWERTIPTLDSLIGQIGGQAGNTGITANQSGALGALGGAGLSQEFLPGVRNLASDLMAGGKDRTGMVNQAYSELRGGLLPYTTMDTNPYSNEAFSKATGYITDDITNRIKSQYAGAGYSPVRSGDYGKTLAEGVSRGVAPAWLQASNDLENRKLGAIGGLYGAGNTTAGLLSGMDQTALQNRQAGAGMYGAAQQLQDAPYLRLLETEAQRRGIPMQNLAQLESLIVPMAQLGGTSQSHTQGVTQQSGTSETKVPMAQQIMGGLIGGAGLLGGLGGFGPSGFLTKGIGGFMGGGNPSSFAYGSNPFTPYGTINPAYG